MKNKYKAKTVYYSHTLNRPLTEYEINRHLINPYKGIIRFDSRLEFKVFQVLRNSHLVSDIIPHHQIKLIPKNTSLIFPTGKNWKVDFLVKGHHKELLFLVEAKGIIGRDFPYLLNLLEQNRPELFSKLWLVFHSKIPNSKLFIKHLRKSKGDSPKIVTLHEFQQQFS